MFIIEGKGVPASGNVNVVVFCQLFNGIENQLVNQSMWLVGAALGSSLPKGHSGTVYTKRGDCNEPYTYI